MLLLPESVPEVHALFDSGKHVVRRSSSVSFNSVFEDSKSRKGGIIGISQQESATLKWYLTVHVRTAITGNFKSFCQLNDVEEPIHRSLTKSMIMKDEQDIQSITSVIMDRFGNPFTIASDVEELEKLAPLINMATGVVAPDEVTKELLTGKELGRMALKDYVEHCLQDQDISMIKPIKRLNLKTFATMERFSAKGRKQAQAILESDRELFGRILVISKDRSVDLKELFTYELSRIPQAIANSDGSLSKTNKAHTLRDLEADVQSTDHEHLMQIVNK